MGDPTYGEGGMTHERAEMLRESGTAKVTALKEAVLSKNLDEAMAKLCDIDEYLTGVQPSYYRGNNRQRLEMLDELGKVCRNQNGYVKVYLSDGGISRLFIEVRSGECSLRITDNATDRVKFLFPKN